MTENENTQRQPRQLWLVPFEGRTGHHLVADVAVKVPTTRLYSYAVPEALTEAVCAGAAVRVPYGRSQRVVDGFCVRVSQRPWDQTRKSILQAESGLQWLSEPLIELGLWVSDYYACSPWKTFTAMLPAAARKQRLRNVTYVRATGRQLPKKPTPKQAALLAAIGDAELRRDEAIKRAGVSPAVFNRLRRHGVLECEVRREPLPPGPVTLTEPVEPAGEHQHSGWGGPPCPPVRSAGGRGGPPHRVTHFPDAHPEPMGECAEDRFELTAGQQSALGRIRAARDGQDVFRVFLLFGVPGSGKTEVYIRTMRAVIHAGRQAILLIPEIALATQVVERLSRRFERVAVLHSQLSARMRHDTLAAIAAGKVDVVIGTRTAVFAPCPRLGLLVVDEEQESSFKNLAAPYYHARDVAIKRGQLEGVPVVLGSATPALETWYNAQHRPHFELVRLPERVPGAKLPRVSLVVSSDREGRQAAMILSPELHDQLAQTLADGQQAIILHNRRGYAVYLRCASCGLMVSCLRCGCHLVYHQYRTERVMKCHRCGARAAVPPRCLDDTCGGRLERTGRAIQHLEEVLRRSFPKARLLRLDSDTMRRRDDYRHALAGFEAGEADIMLGTQMVAKGLDFPRVRLVGVIEADAMLSLPDFRAGERVFQLIVQVVGRAGRREGTSLALVQTAARPAPAIRHALRMDYETFAGGELEQRQRLFYPPLARLVRLICADSRAGRAREAAEHLAEVLRDRATRIHAGLRVDAAEPCIVPRLREMLRYQVLVRGPRAACVHTLLHEIAAEKLPRPAVQRFTIDVDPVDLL